MASRVLVFGDIHGYLAKFEALLTHLVPGPDDHLVVLGDVIDRGPESAGVVSRIIKLSQTNQVSFVMGNHEQMMLDAGTSRNSWIEWMQNGGDATMQSYGGPRATLKDVPAEHWEFLKTKLVDFVETQTHIFVHANAYADLPMVQQPDYMLRWERCDHIQPHESGKIIVCGHTPQRSGSPMNRGFAICIDTNAARGGPLTCLDALSGDFWQADSLGRIRKEHVSSYYGY